MGYSSINVTGGGRGGSTYFLGSKILTSCIFLGLKNLRVFFWVRISARLIVLTQFKPIVYFGGSKMSSLVFFWVHNIRSMYFFGCKILGSVGPLPPPPPPSRLYLSNPPGLNIFYGERGEHQKTRSTCFIGSKTTRLHLVVLNPDKTLLLVF